MQYNLTLFFMGLFQGLYKVDEAAEKPTVMGMME
jgi:hypothetical protein